MRTCLRAAIVALMALCVSLVPAKAFSHSTRATMDVGGSSATFTGLARVTCFNDGSGNAALLMARVRDISAPVSGLLVNMQLVKGAVALSITDPVSGDANYSDYIALPGGNGEYIMMLNKTAAGTRTFDIEWHCMTGDNLHTGTDITVQQFK